MTICIAWIRKVNNCEELVFASDSRLRYGEYWDQCPKIMSFERQHCALAFAGHTYYAYPLMMQVYYAINQYYKIKSRAMDINDLNGYLLRSINSLSSSIVYDAKGNFSKDIVQNEFIFGGYLWTEKKFKLWMFKYDEEKNAFQKHSPFKNFLGKFGKIAIIGDKQKEFKNKLCKFLNEKYGAKCSNYIGRGFDMEPFEVLRNMLLEADSGSTIGGAPQIIKVYQYMNSRPLGVYWPQKDNYDVFKNRTLLGRKVPDFEDTEYWFMDPYTFYTNACHKNKTLNENNEEIE